LIKLTRDGGAHWSDVTPKNVALWAKVASLDISALKSGTAYAAIDGHRIDDFSPHLLRTRDYGQSWQDISSTLPAGHFVDVVRADPVRGGLLYAGTDQDAFLSIDDGGHWKSLGDNLPVAWVTDLLVHDNDLIASTQGRGIWVLDDLAPLREPASQTASAYLFHPAPAYRVHPNNNADTPLPPETPMGSNPAVGAVIDYWLGEKPVGPVVLEFRDAAGGLVRRFSSADKPEKLNAKLYFAADWTKSPQVLSAVPGFHRFVWNLRYDRPPAISYSYGIASVWGRAAPIEPEGPYVLPGNYQLTLVAGGEKLSASIAVREDPRIQVNNNDLSASLKLSAQIGQLLAQNRQAFGEEQAATKQLRTLFPNEDRNPAGASDPLKALAEKIVRKPVPGEPTWTTVDSILTAVETDLESVDSAPTAAQRALVTDTAAKLAQLERSWAAAKAGPLAQLNAGLLHKSHKQVTIPPAAALDVQPPEEGEDSP
jgi:hypothetical protein